MDRSKFPIVIAGAIVLVLLGTAIVAFQLGAVVKAQEGTPSQQSAEAGMTPMLLQYQGRLSDPDSGKPVEDGSYTMVLRLYSAASGGKPLWAEAKDVTVQDGLFSTVLGDSTPLNQNLFNGRTLWLGIKVGADEEAEPRQQVLPVAYAVGLLPGAVIEADGKTAALTVNNDGSGQALHAEGPVVIDGNLAVNGRLSGDHAADASAHHKRYTDDEAISAALSSSEIVTQYEFEDHIYGGMHNGRAIAYGSIDQFGNVHSATGNVSSKWVKIGNTEYYEITIDGHTYDQRYYVTTGTSIFGIVNAWDLDGMLAVGISHPNGQAIKQDSHFVTFKP